MNKIERILAEVLMKHHDDISRQDVDAISQAQQEIWEAVWECLPERQDPEKEFRRNVNYKLHPDKKDCEIRWNFQIRCQGFNNAIYNTQENLKKLFEEE